MASRYFERMVARLKQHLADKKSFTKADLEAAIRKARAEAGGLARAEQQSGGHGDAAAALADLLTTEDSFEDEIREMGGALRQKFGDDACLIATFDDHVIFCLYYPYDEMNPSAPMVRYFDCPYEENEDTEAITWGQPQELEKLQAFTPLDNQQALSDIMRDTIALVYTKAGASGSAKGGKPTLPPNVQKLPEKQQRQWVDIWNSTYKRCKDKGGSDKDCESSAFAQANGTVKAEDADPDVAGILRVLGGAAPQAAAAGLARTQPHPSVTLTDHGFRVALRLADANGVIPAWQQYHKIGDWAVPHGVSGKIQFTREMGDQIIRNFRAKVLRRGVPLDEGHGTDSGGHALAWVDDEAGFRWGKEGEGLPGAPEPSGAGDILFCKLNYNDLGQHKLSNRHYQHQSPQYDLDYVDKETGIHYGCTALALAATNNPYLRLQTLQGEPAPEPVLLEDGLAQWGEAIMPELAEVQKNLEETKRELAEYRQQLEAERKALADERTRRQVEAITAYSDRMVREGVPPAAMRIASKILLQSAEDAPKVITLSDAPDATPDLNLHEAIKALVNEFPKTPFNTVTRGSDSRPENRKALDDQIEQSAKEIVETFGLITPAIKLT
jgi:hypothetical protein